MLMAETAAACRALVKHSLGTSGRNVNKWQKKTQKQLHSNLHNKAQWSSTWHHPLFQKQTLCRTNPQILPLRQWLDLCSTLLLDMPSSWASTSCHETTPTNRVAHSCCDKTLGIILSAPGTCSPLTQSWPSTQDLGWPRQSSLWRWR